MAHIQIIGMTMSGKSTLARQLAQNYRAQGVQVLLYDPLYDPKFEADFKTKSPSEFFKVFFNSRRCAVFIDEAPTLAQDNENCKKLVQVATLGRHWGHNVHYIGQRGAMLPKTLRDQTTQLFMFCTSKDDCKIYSNEWNNDELLKGNSLEQGEFFYCSRFSPVERLRVF